MCSNSMVRALSLGKNPQSATSRCMALYVSFALTNQSSAHFTLQCLILRPRNSSSRKWRAVCRENILLSGPVTVFVYTVIRRFWIRCYEAVGHLFSMIKSVVRKRKAALYLSRRGMRIFLRCHRLACFIVTVLFLHTTLDRSFSSNVCNLV